VNPVRCTGCGVCVLTCPIGALGLVRRPDDEVMQIPQTHEDWGAQRTAERGKAD